MSDLTTPPSAEAPKAPEVQKAPEVEITIPAPAKGADYDAVAAMHQDLVNAGDAAIAAAFHKKHVLGFKQK